MKENENSYNNNMSELDEEKVNYQEILFKYIIHWPWFIATPGRLLDLQSQG